MAVSTNTMIQQLATKVDNADVTKVDNADVTKEDNEFIKNILIATQGGTITAVLTDKHIETLRRIWFKFFVG